MYLEEFQVLRLLKYNVTLFVLPSLYYLIEKRKEPEIEKRKEHE